MNASSKCDAVRNKIEESSCSVVCIQETKREHFEMLSSESLPRDVSIVLTLFRLLEPLEGS